jgi:hypothetical protein
VTADPHKRSLAVLKPFALVVALVVAALAELAMQDDARKSDQSAPSPAARAFERLKSLEGAWVGKSTNGWEERVVYRTIAAGSCVMQTSFDAHPNEMMVTMFHLDGERLLLTHYCVAKNQPRLMATNLGDEGSSITFTFLDGTGLKNGRDAGHMDKVVYTFKSPDEFASRWTWYQDGQERWLEEIVHTRMRQESDQQREAPAVTPTEQEHH